MKSFPGLKIYLVDDDKMFLKALEFHLLHSMKPDVKIKSFLSGETCLDNLNEKPDIVVLDYLLSNANPDAMNGLDVLQRIKKTNPEIKVIMLSGIKELNVVVETIKSGAWDYVLKNENVFARTLKDIRVAVAMIAFDKKEKNNRILLRFLTVVVVLSLLVYLKNHWH